MQVCHSMVSGSSMLARKSSPFWPRPTDFSKWPIKSLAASDGPDSTRIPMPSLSSPLRQAFPPQRDFPSAPRRLLDICCRWRPEETPPSLFSVHHKLLASLPEKNDGGRFAGSQQIARVKIRYFFSAGSWSPFIFFLLCFWWFPGSRASDARQAQGFISFFKALPAVRFLASLFFIWLFC